MIWMDRGFLEFQDPLIYLVNVLVFYIIKYRVPKGLPFNLHLFSIDLHSLLEDKQCEKEMNLTSTIVLYLHINENAAAGPSKTE